MLWCVARAFFCCEVSITELSHSVSGGTYRFEVFATAVNVAHPISTDLSTTTPFARSFCVLRIGADDSVIQITLLVTLRMHLEVGSQVLLLRERPAIA